MLGVIKPDEGDRGRGQPTMIHGRHDDSLEDKRGKRQSAFRLIGARAHDDVQILTGSMRKIQIRCVTYWTHQSDAVQSTRRGPINDRQRHRWQRDARPVLSLSIPRRLLVPAVRVLYCRSPKKSVHLCYDSYALYWSVMGKCQINYSPCRIDSDHLAIYQIKPCTSFLLVLAYQRSTWLLIKENLLSFAI